MSMYIRPFAKLSSKNVSFAGGKGASLGEMTQAGIPVPAGFVIGSEAFEKFLKDTDLHVEISAALDSVDHRKMHTVEQASEVIEALIMGANMPKDIATDIQQSFKKLGAKFVAVRSSATAEDSKTAAWAGQLESFLNTTEKSLLLNVKKCWASLFTPRAIFYRFEKGMEKDKISVAVVVQKMVESDAAGIAFSVHPVTQDRNQIIIEAALGLGEAVVSGSITPDSYVVGKRDFVIQDKKIINQKRGLFKGKEGGTQWRDVMFAKGSQQTLSDKEIIALTKLVTKIERHYGFAVDVEWAKENGKLFIVQSRPITTLDEVPAPMEDSGNEFKFRWGQKQSAMTYECMNWQMYKTVDDKARVIDSGIPTTCFLLIDGVSEHHMPDVSMAHLGKNGKKYFSKVFAEALFKGIDKHVKNFFKLCGSIYGIDLKKLSDRELKKITTSYRDLITQTFIYFGTSNPWWTDQLADEIKRILSSKAKNEEEMYDYFISLSTPDEADETMKERLDFMDLVLKKKISEANLERYSRKYPALFFNTYDKHEVLDFLSGKAKEESLKDLGAEKKRIKENLLGIQKMHRKIYAKMKSPALKRYARILQKSGLDRYRLKHTWSGAEYMCLDLVHELHRRIGGDFHDFIKTYMFTDVLNFLDGKGRLPADEVKKRKGCLLQHFYDGTIHRYTGKEALAYKAKLLPPKIEVVHTSASIKGEIANKGYKKGKARVVLVKDLKQFVRDSESFKKGEILVTTMTSPIMIPIIEKASGIITDEGGICSHAAVSAREFKIPCVIGTHNASSTIQTGDEIELDASRGIVNILERASKR